MDYEEINKSLKEIKGWEKLYSDWEYSAFDEDTTKEKDSITEIKTDVIYFDFAKPKAEDKVNSPKHYTAGKVEVIEVIEDAIKDAPTTKEGMLQAQVIKYILRMWLKSNPLEDAQKAEWYLNRLIESLK